MKYSGELRRDDSDSQNYATGYGGEQAPRIAFILVLVRFGSIHRSAPTKHRDLGLKDRRNGNYSRYTPSALHGPGNNTCMVEKIELSLEFMFRR
jgi:hypothetical protein